MTINTAGNQNTTAQVVPGLNINIVPPKVANLNGVPTNRLLVVGTATDGPLNSPVVFSDMASFEKAFGKLQNRKFDMGTQVATAILQGANNFLGVRISDGTQVQAAGISYVGTANAANTAINFTALDAGTNGNNIVATYATGSKVNTYKLTLTNAPVGVLEVYDNLPLTSASFTALVDGIMNGNTLYARSGAPSALVSAVVGNTTANAATLIGNSLTLSSGTDGANNVNATVMVGSDGAVRTGMYAARKQGASVGVLADCDDHSAWSAQAAFGESEGIYFVVNGPANDTIANAVTQKQATGVDSYALKVMHGDFLNWVDPTNSVTRLVSPQGFTAGRIANLSPQNSTLNKPLFGIVGSQKVGSASAGTVNTYSDAELQSLFQAGIDVITNPAPGGAYWAVRGGINSSSNNALNGDNYTRMTNYLAATLNAGMGVYVGQTINTDLFGDVTISIESFLSQLLSQGLLARQEDDSLPYLVLCNAGNNPRARTDAGYLYAKVQVRYQSIARFFNIDAEGGQTVVVTVANN